MRGFSNSIVKIIENLKEQVNSLNSNYANIPLSQMSSLKYREAMTAFMIMPSATSGSAIVDTILRPGSYNNGVLTLVSAFTTQGALLVTQRVEPSGTGVQIAFNPLNGNYSHGNFTISQDTPIYYVPTT